MVAIDFFSPVDVEPVLETKPEDSMIAVGMKVSARHKNKNKMVLIDSLFTKYYSIALSYKLLGKFSKLHRIFPK